MKKFLLGTTAIVAAGMIVAAPSAQAAEKLKVSVGGYMEQWFGYVSADDDTAGSDFSGFDQKSDAEIHFVGMTKLDNGIEVGINVQLEANSNTGDQIDESYAIIKGAFGEINFGSENSAMYKMHYAPSDFGIGMNSGDQVDWVNPQSIGTAGYFRGTYGSTYIEPARANDSEKLTYYTPRIEGFQLGLSYAPDEGQDSNVQPNRDAVRSDSVMVGLNFSREFSGFGVNLSAGFGTATGKVTDSAATTVDESQQPTAFNIGAVFTYGGFEVGLAYAAADEQDNVSGGTSGEAMNLGASYSSGPWGVSVGYFHGEKDGQGIENVNLTGQGEQDTFMLSAKYALGPGVTAAGTIGYTQFKSDNVALSAAAKKVDGTYVVVGLRLSF
jgi:outer membrane protein OmpU